MIEQLSLVFSIAHKARMEENYLHKITEILKAVDKLQKEKSLKYIQMNQALLLNKFNLYI